MSGADNRQPDATSQATAMLIQAAVKSGEARSIMLATQQALASAAADLGNTASLLEQARSAGLQAGHMSGFRSGYISGLICGAAVGACAAMLLRAVLA